MTFHTAVLGDVRPDPLAIESMRSVYWSDAVAQPFSNDEIRHFLAEGGYTANPEGLIRQYP
jgi:hypothetical protein